MSEYRQRTARTRYEIRLGNEGSEMVVIPAGTEVVIERWYDGAIETVDVSAWFGQPQQQDFWVRPVEIEFIDEGETT